MFLKYLLFLKKWSWKNDRVAGYVPNTIERLQVLASAKNGYIWSSCSPDFGVQGLVDRFRQIEPKVLLLVIIIIIMEKKLIF